MDGEAQAVHGWDATATLWNPLTLDSQAVGAGPAPKSRGRRGSGARCQVAGCTESLLDCKPYFKRHLVCQTHAIMPVVILDDVEMRFCQQCAKFERLSAFDSGNRSCRFRLTRRNLAKQKSLQAKAAAAQTGGGAGAAAGQSPDVPRGKGRGGSSSEPQASGSSEGRDTRCNDADPELTSHRRNTNGTSAPSPSSKRTRLSVEPKSGSGVQEESQSHDSRVTPLPCSHATSVGDAQDLAADALVPFTSALRLDSTSGALPTSVIPTTATAAATTAAAAATATAAAAAAVTGAAAPAVMAVPGAPPQQPQPQPQSLLRADNQQPFVTLAKAPPVSEEAAAAADAAAGASGMGSGGRGSGGKGSGGKGSGGKGSDGKQQRVLNDYDAPGVGAGRTPFGPDAAKRPGPGPQAAAAALGMGIGMGCSVAAKAARAVSMDSSITAALKSLSQRPGLSHSERVALESLLGLMQSGGGGRGAGAGAAAAGASVSPGAGLTLPVMADSAALDSQLHEIMNDVLQDNAGWCQALAPGRAITAAAGAGAGAGGAPTAATSAPAGWASAYLGLGPGAAKASGAMPPYPSLPPPMGSGIYPHTSVVASTRDSTTGLLSMAPHVPALLPAPQQPQQLPALLQLQAQAQQQQQQQWLVQQQQLAQAQQQQQQQQQQLMAARQAAAAITDGSWGSGGPATSGGTNGAVASANPMLRAGSAHSALGPMIPVVPHAPFGPMTTTMAAAAAVVAHANLPAAAPTTSSDASQADALLRSFLTASPAHPWTAAAGAYSQQPAFPHPHPHQLPAASPSPHTSMLTDAPTPTGGACGAASSGISYAHADGVAAVVPVSAAAVTGASGAASASATGSGPAMLVDEVIADTINGPGTNGPGTGATGLSSGDGAWGRALASLAAAGGQTAATSGADGDGGGGLFGLPMDDYHSDFDMVRLSYKLADCDPYSLDPSTPSLLQQVAAEGCPGLAGPMPTSVRPGCVRVIANASVRLAPPLADSLFGRDVGPCGGSAGGDGPGDGGGCGFNARAPGVLAAMQQLAMLNDSGVLLQAGLQTIAVTKEGVEVAPPAPPLPSLQLPSLTRASVAAVHMGARGSIQLFGCGLAAPHVELWGRMHGVHYQLQVQHATDAYALVALPVLPACGLLTIEAEWAPAAASATAASAAEGAADSWAAPSSATGTSSPPPAPATPPASAAGSAVLSDWLAVAVVPTERVAAELNALQGRLPPLSLRRLLSDVGSLLDVRPLLAQPINGLCPVVSAAGGGGVPASSGCSKNTWRSSSMDQDAVCGAGGLDGDGPGGDDAATVANVLDGFATAYSCTTVLTSSQDGPSSKATLGAATTATGRSSSSFGPGTNNGASTNGASTLGTSAAGGASTSASTASATAASASTAAARAAAAVDLAVFMGGAGAAAAAAGGRGGGRSAMALQNVHRLLGCFDTSELLTNADDETVVERLLGPGPAAALLSRAVSTLTFFANRGMVDSALCVVAALSELHRAFPDLLRADLAPPLPPPAAAAAAAAPGLMHAAVRCRSLALLLALARCGDVLGEHVSFGRRGPGGVTPLHLVALLGEPHVMAGLHLAAPGVRELWHTAADDSGATPADMLARSLAASASAAADGAGAGAGAAPAAAGGLAGARAGASAQGSAQQQLLPLLQGGSRVSAGGGLGVLAGLSGGGRALAGFGGLGAPGGGGGAPPPIRVLAAASQVGGGGAAGGSGTVVISAEQLLGEELPSDLSPVVSETRPGLLPRSGHRAFSVFAPPQQPPLPGPQASVAAAPSTAPSSQVQSAVAEALVRLPSAWGGSDAGDEAPAPAAEPDTPGQGLEQEAAAPTSADALAAEPGGGEPEQRLRHHQQQEGPLLRTLQSVAPTEKEEAAAAAVAAAAEAGETVGSRAGAVGAVPAPAAAAAGAPTPGLAPAPAPTSAAGTAAAVAVLVLLVALLMRQLGLAGSAFGLA
ncbi:hypothetical protein HYH02_009243 [Chlamydomonas schloesseri]|uniref:SBP-type domain-containing protein n=1 Tax=Chlamydomonas schloesseri TaxID=2026947 RepID=A0A835WB22_9CHLO|nr:hypothetical protein HYH02_009243 [Chlamydomonas schloesseri]|eukprot:KAG2444045.1 hypothetical protein HYH02_009243 [Chlamydomonas schloesseri]